MKPQEEHNEAEKGKRNMEKLFDLQVFAQENTQTTGGLSAEMKTYYGMELLDNAKPQLVHNQFAATKPLPTGGGKTVEWRKFGSFDKALTPLTEGVTRTAAASPSATSPRSWPSTATTPRYRICWI